MAGLAVSAGVRETRSSGQGFRFRLRQETAAAHVHLDGKFSKLDLRSAAGYGRFLAANAAALLPLEAVLSDAGVAGIVPDWHRRARSNAILSDLLILGEPVESMEVTLELDRAGVLGALYVLEGSRLGAKVLLRQVSASTDARVLAARRYLSHGASGNFWPEFVALLEREIVTPADEAEAITAARAAFDLFADAAERHLAPRR